jgi:hypothetical protein
MAEKTELDLAIRKNAINSGIVLGAVSFVLGIFSFYYITSMTSSFWMIIFGPLIFSVILPIIISVFTMLDIRKKIGGFWNFRQATTGAFIMFMVCYILSGVASFGFRKLIEPDMVLKTQTAMVDATTAMMEKSGADQEKIDKQTSDVKKKFEDQIDPSIGATVKSIAIAIILFFVVALIYGAIFKKDKPLFDVIDPEPTV